MTITMSQQVFAIFFFFFFYFDLVSVQGIVGFFLISKNFCLAFGESIDVYQIIVSNFYIETISRCVICHKKYWKRYKSYTRTSIHAFLSCLLSCVFFSSFFFKCRNWSEMKWNPFESHDLIAIQKQRNPIIRWAIISIYSLSFWVIAMREIIKRLVWFLYKIEKLPRNHVV